MAEKGAMNNPLHISLFPPEERAPLEFQFLLSSCLDIFEARLPHKTVDQDFGLLQAVDERLAMYGWLTNTGVKFVVVVDMEGRPANPLDAKSSTAVGLRDADLKPAFRALQTAYIVLLRNPFYNPDEHSPVTQNGEQRYGSTQITSKKFIQEIKRSDPAQHRLALHLQNLYENLKDYEPKIEYSDRLKQISRAVGTSRNAPPERARGLWTYLLAKKDKRDSLALTRTLTSHEAAMALQTPKGLMLHGEVGTGKSMLIDLFADCLPNRKKRRWHFNTFMLQTLSRLEELRTSRSSSPFDGVAQDEYSLLWLARDLIEKSPILFLDEFQLPDRAASKILSNLMTSFFQLGGVLIATSNRMPEELAKAAGMEFARPFSRLSRLGWGLGMQGMVGRDDGPGQKGEFAQFLEVLRTRCEVWEMEGKQDYRRITGMEGSSICSAKATSRINSQGLGQQSVITELDDASTPADSEVTLPKHYLLTPSSTATEAEVNLYHQSLTTSAHTATSTPALQRIAWTSFALRVYGRPLHIPLQCNGVALFSFDQICGAPLGPADYITLASTYSTIIITSVPVLTLLQKNEARRFITLLDAMYEARCRLLIAAVAPPDEIFFPSSASTEKTVEEIVDDAVHPETYSEIHQDLTSPFRPNISSYNPSSSLPMDSLEDDPPNRFRRSGSSYADERRTGTHGPDFANIGGLTGEDERFAVKRAESRIWEMCSQIWWEKEDCWRPLPRELRHWEKARPATGNVMPVAKVQERAGAPNEMIPQGQSPFRTREDAPPKIAWTHIWGAVKWGKRAGAWGKGVEGLDERKREVLTGEAEDGNAKREQ
ncbi:hypothetical protein SLS60_000622 [Paraconiothyrium brasiliense]|uniref:AAA+ ATPase domain-containing protein n=1 Tax=Paraconiothyrium brasiliense TaxID=300254 RepID=A0ABR3S6T0_9PLEO